MAHKKAGGSSRNGRDSQAKRLGVKAFGGEMIPLTQEDIALMAGTTRATVNEVLHEFQRTGAVKICRGRIEVLNRTTLVKRLR